MPDLRVPFQEAIDERRLLKGWFHTLSVPQQVSLKVMYGCELDGTAKDSRGWTEFDYWAMLQGSCEYDDLGYLTTVYDLPYHPKEYNEAWMMAGIRAGKSSALAATVTAYEATCGGHEEHTRKDRPVVCFQIAQDLRLAKYSLHSIKGIIEMMPWCKDWVVQVTADRIDLKNNVTIAVTPPTVKSIRGYDAPVAVLDEVAIWYTEADSANPDFEIYNQAKSRQAQFNHPKVVGISSPWATQGLLHQRALAGTEGQKLVCDTCRAAGRTRNQVDCPGCTALRKPHLGRLFLHATSAGLGSPAVKHHWLVEQRDADPRNFARECLAIPQESISGFLDARKIDLAVDRGVVERPPQERNVYVAAMDPAFRQDTFAFTIVHMDPRLGVVQDVVRQWKPAVGTSLNPAEILPEIGRLLKQYRTFGVYSDQFQFEALLQLAYQHGFGIEGVDFTASSKADIYGNLKSLVAQGRIRLLDDSDTIRELKQLEMQLTQGGGVRIAAPRQAHDDLATVVALAAQKAVWMMPAAAREEPKPLTLEQQCQQQAMAKVHEMLNMRSIMDGDSEDW